MPLHERSVRSAPITKLLLLLLVAPGCFSSAASSVDAGEDALSVLDGAGDTSSPADAGADAPPATEAGPDGSTADGGSDAAADVTSGADAAGDAPLTTDAAADAPAPIKAWTWIGGSNTASSTGSYGTLGTPAAGNAPPAREGASAATGPGGKLWLFGGYSYVGSSANSYLEDLWSYDTGTGDWTWAAGSSTPGGVSAYPGTQGTGGSSSYFPGARRYASLWVDASGNVWLFGGNDGSTSYSDLWKFDGTYWTWIAGSNLAAQASSYPSSVGMGGAGFGPGGRQGAASWVDASGDLWLFGGLSASGQYLGDLWKFNTSAGWTWEGGSSSPNVAGTYGTRGSAASGNAPGARQLSAFGVDASGAFWLYGGYGKDSAGNGGYLGDLWKYSGGSWTWVSGGNVGSSPTASVAYGAYPSSTGMGGSTYVPGARESSSAWLDSTGNFWVFGGWGYDGSGTQSYLNDLWKFDGTSWTWVAGSDVANVAGAYGSLGVAQITNEPGTRWNPDGWYAAGKLWMFGGSGYDRTGTTTAGVLNDLWTYQP